MDGVDGIWWLRSNYARQIELTEMAKFGAYAAFGSSLRLYVGTRSAFPLRLILFLNILINGSHSSTCPVFTALILTSNHERPYSRLLSPHE
ncbi:hypothetical protein Csa_001496, partial [Cucumis sativus]